MKILISVVAAVLLFNFQLMGQFTLDGEIRPRMEYRHGYGALADSNARNGLFVQQRSRLIFGHKTDGFKLKVSLQDIRFWGSTAQLNTSDAFSSIHEAWGEAFLNKEWSLKFGRQEIIYDDHRIFGSVEWAQQARSHDAFLVKYRDDVWKMDVGLAYNQLGASGASTLYATADTAGNYIVPANYKSIQYLWVNRKFSDKFNTSLLFLNNGLQVASTVGSAYWDNYSQTVGPRLMYGAKEDKFKFNFAFYYQMGKDGNIGNSDIAAYDVQIDASYKVHDNVTITLGGEMLSGNDQTDTSVAAITEQKAFTPFYGTNHKFNGHMDYFYVGNHVGSVGLIDGFLKFKWAQKTKEFIALDIHQFMTAGKILDLTELANTGAYKGMDANLGLEIDLSFGMPVSQGVMFKAGYSHMIATKSMEALMLQRGGVNPDKDEINNWAWAMIIMKPNFIGGKK